MRKSVSSSVRGGEAWREPTCMASGVCRAMVRVYLRREPRCVRESLRCRKNEGASVKAIERDGDGVARTV